MASTKGVAPDVEVGGRSYERTLVHTHLIHIKEPLEPLLDSHVRPLLRKGGWVAMSEKVVAISEGRVVHHSVVRPGSAREADREGHAQVRQRRCFQ